MKYPPEFLAHNKSLVSVGSSPMPHYKCFCGRAVLRVVRGLGTWPMHLGYTAAVPVQP